MDGNNMTSTHIIKELEYEAFMKKGVSGVVFLAILSVVGTFGNIHTIIVYGFSPEMKKRAVRIFIIWLATADLVVSLFCMPFEMFDLRYDYTFSASAVCSFFRYLTQASSFISVGFLTVIAIERGYITRKSVQFTQKPASWYYKISIIMVSIFLVLTSPALVVYGANQKEIPGYTNLTGNDCSVLEEYKKAWIFITYGVVVIVWSIVCFLTMTIVYAKILITLLSQMRKETQSPKPEENNYDRGRKVTISLMVASFVSFFGYIVFISVNLVGIGNPKYYKSADGLVYSVLLRFFFLNNAVNPVVYCAIDDHFRSECILMYRRCLKNKKKQTQIDDASLNTLSTNDESSI